VPGTSVGSSSAADALVAPDTVEEGRGTVDVRAGESAADEAFDESAALRAEWPLRVEDTSESESA
jgi:hypothetical protein